MLVGRKCTEIERCIRCASGASGALHDQNTIAELCEILLMEQENSWYVPCINRQKRIVTNKKSMTGATAVQPPPFTFPNASLPAGVVAVLGSTYTGEFEDVEAMDAMLGMLRQCGHVSKPCCVRCRSAKRVQSQQRLTDRGKGSQAVLTTSVALSFVVINVCSASSKFLGCKS